ncbi:hypothetical protein LZ30DRAFT_652142 [Colletotrichum cereale]|nr:hypothetical protein LZ30DRAFT_652142 [Colletotrichum cereale]
MSVLSATVISYKPSRWASQLTLDQHTLLCTVWPQYLSLQEACDIIKQFDGQGWLKDQQLLWSGTTQAEVHRIANEHGMQTLRVAMGPLMDPDNPSCLKARKSSSSWSKYIKGASLIFAWRISQGEVATIMTPPPPDCFHPSEMTNLQDIELPVLQGCLGNRPVGRIFLWHPTVKGAESFRYQIWPVDHTSSWYDKFEPLAQRKSTWRRISKHRVSTSWAVKTDVGHFLISETFAPLKRTYLKLAEIIINVCSQLTLLVKLFLHCILLLAMVARLLIQILIRDETDLDETGRVETQPFVPDSGHKAKTGNSCSSSEVNQRTEIRDGKAGEVEQALLHLITADASTALGLADCSTQDSPTTVEKVYAPIMVPVESSAPAEGSDSSPKLSKAAAKKLRKLQKLQKLQRQQEKLKAEVAEMSSTAEAQLAVGA